MRRQSHNVKAVPYRDLTGPIVVYRPCSIVVVIVAAAAPHANLIYGIIPLTPVVSHARILPLASPRCWLFVPPASVNENGLGARSWQFDRQRRVWDSKSSGAYSSFSSSSFVIVLPEVDVSDVLLPRCTMRLIQFNKHAIAQTHEMQLSSNLIRTSPLGSLTLETNKQSSLFPDLCWIQHVCNCQKSGFACYKPLFQNGRLGRNVM